MKYNIELFIDLYPTEHASEYIFYHKNAKFNTLRDFYNAVYYLKYSIADHPADSYVRRYFSALYFNYLSFVETHAFHRYPPVIILRDIYEI